MVMCGTGSAREEQQLWACVAASADLMGRKATRGVRFGSRRHLCNFLLVKFEGGTNESFRSSETSEGVLYEGCHDWGGAAMS